MLSDVEIRKEIASGELSIEPFQEESLEPASYDLHIGRVLLEGRGVFEPSSLQCRF